MLQLSVRFLGSLNYGRGQDKMALFDPVRVEGRKKMLSRLSGGGLNWIFRECATFIFSSLLFSRGEGNYCPNFFYHLFINNCFYL